MMSMSEMTPTLVNALIPLCYTQFYSLMCKRNYNQYRP